MFWEKHIHVLQAIEGTYYCVSRECASSFSITETKELVQKGLAKRHRPIR